MLRQVTLLDMTFDSLCKNASVCARSMEHLTQVTTELELERTPTGPGCNTTATQSRRPPMYCSRRPSIALAAACSLLHPPCGGLLLGRCFDIRDIEQRPVDRKPDRTRVAAHRCENHLVILA